tara:strand:+ start:728 stop:841 length:114 start_codon:yes stop_codon:yes gene_type:complete
LQVVAVAVLLAVVEEQVGYDHLLQEMLQAVELQQNQL